VLLAAGLGAQEASEPTSETLRAPAPGGFEPSDLVERATALQERFEAEREEALADKALGYDPMGRRDPFRPLVGVTVEQEDRGRLPGIAGLHWEELSLIGVVETEAGPLSIFFGGPDQRGYFVREGMNFYNGSVHRIDAVGSMVTIRQKIEDRNQLKPYRDIDIRLHPLDEMGQ
jgi:type IV pilus assembly protein PilP